MLDLFILLISVFTMGLLGLLILSRNSLNITFQLFGFLTAVSIAWDLVNYLSNHIQNYSAQLFTNKLSLFVGFLLIIAVWLLSVYFPRQINSHKRQKVTAIILSVILLFITLFTNTIVKTVLYNKQQKVSEITTGSLYVVYLAISVIFLVFLIYNFYKSYRSRKLSHLQRQQILFVAFGFILAYVWSLITAAIVPAVTHSWEISKYSSAGSWMLVILTSYAIVKHRLFDIRLAVARSITYIVTFSLLAILFVAPAIFITTKLLNTHLNSLLIFVLILITFVVAIAFQPLKNLFNRYTNRFFYRDFYEPQEVLDRLSNLLVGSIEVKSTIHGSAQILSDALKPTFLKFQLTTNRTSPDEYKVPKIFSGKVMSIDSLDQQQDATSYKLFVDQNISVIARLRVSSKDIGFIIVGYRLSGSSYNDIDLRLLGIAADEIAISLQNAFRFEEIENFSKTLQEKIEAATHQLRKANERLKVLDETKDDFISMASHQLRTPLTSVKGYISMILEGDAGKINHTQHEMLGQAFFSSQRMVYLIADMLNVSRLKTGKFAIENSEVNLADVVEQEMGQLKETAESHSVTLTYNKPKDFPNLMLDETKIRQVIMNFADNAIYYTPKNGHIEVNLKDNPGTVELTVKDDGIGVPKSERHHLFTKFYRAGNARKVRPDGTGIGLYMAKKVIAAQGGSIIFDSEEGKGSTFGFVISKALLSPKGKSIKPKESEAKQTAKV